MPVRSSEIATLLEALRPEDFKSLKARFSESDFEQFISFRMGEKSNDDDEYVFEVLAEGERVLLAAEPQVKDWIVRAEKKLARLAGTQFGGQVVGFLGGATGIGTVSSAPAVAVFGAALALFGGLLSIVAKYLDSPLGQPSLLSRYTEMTQIEVESRRLRQQIQFVHHDVAKREVAERCLEDANKIAGRINKLRLLM